MTFIGMPLNNKKPIIKEERSDPFVLASSNIANVTKVEYKKISQPRASSIYDSCIRMHVLCTQLHRKQKVYYTIKDILTFGIGKAVHYWAQNFPDLYGEERYGLWKCLSCGFVQSFGPFPKIKCPKCAANSTAWVYHEFGGDIKVPLKFSFHIDMFKKCGDVYQVREIKTISRDAFNVLKAPLIQHEYQMHTYILGCYYSKNFPVKLDIHNSYIDYLSKEHTSKTIPIKTFLVKTNKALIQNIKHKLELYKNGIINYPKSMPEIDSVCAKKNYDCWKAKTCPVLAECKKL